MAISLFANNIQTTLATSITSTQTLITLASTAGLPNPSAGQYFVMTFTSGTTNEVVWVTNVSGSNITCIRGQEGTATSAFAAGSYASCFPTAGTMQNLVQIDQYQNGIYNFANGGGTANALTASITSNLSSLPNGFSFILNAANANTGAATLNLTLNPTIAGASPISTGALPIYQNGSFPLTGGEISGSNYLCLISYNSNYNGGLGAFVLENPYNAVVGVVGITQVQSEYYTYATSGGSSDALTLTLPAGLTTLTDGAIATFRNTVSANATTTPTLNVTYGSTATGATVIKKYNNQPLSAGDTGGVNYVCQMVYSSSASAWMLLNPAPGVAGGVTSLTGGTGITVSSPSGAVTVTNSGVLTVNGSSGTVTVTAASIGAGSLSGTNTWSGSNAFTSGITTSANNTASVGGKDFAAWSCTGGGFNGFLSPTSLQLATSGSGISCNGANLSFFVGGGGAYIYDSTGSMTIPGNLTILSGNGYKPGGGSWATYSDARLKENVMPLTGALSKILELNPVVYDWKYQTNEPTVGFIAQEVQEVLPNAVTYSKASEDQKQLLGDEDILSIGWQNDIFAYLIGAIKELNQKQVELEHTISVQASYIKLLQTKV